MERVRKIFSEEKANQLFQDMGYYVVPNFLNASQVADLLICYRKQEQSFFDKGFHRTLDMTNEKRKRHICNTIHQIVTPRAQQFLEHYQFLLTSFMTKEKGTGSFDLHQNWSFVDEKKYTSLAIWIPLVDVNEQNGTMFMLPGSHRWPKVPRGNGIPWPYEQQKLPLQNQLIRLDMQAGDAVIFDDATLHYTSPNFTAGKRIAIAQVMIPDEAVPMYYEQNVQTGQVNAYEVSADFYLMFMNRVKARNLTAGYKLLEKLEPFS